MFPALSELETLRQWPAAARNYRDTRLNPGNHAVVYAAAGHEVRGWFARAGTPGWQSLIQQIRSGTEFARAYASEAGGAIVR